MRDPWWTNVAADQAQLLQRLRGLLAEHTGLIFPPERWSSIENAVEKIGKEQGFADARAWLEWFITAPPTLCHMQLLVSHLTVGETYFFRDNALFSALREIIFPSIIDSRRNAGRYLRFWSAGCSTGEEPYSIAIALKRMLPDWRQWRIALLATDINATSLAKAEAGIYDSWSFRAGLPAPHDSDFKQIRAGLFAVAPLVKDMVRFSQLNLANASYPSLASDLHSLDIIFCRNVLMYLEPACAQAIIDRFSHTLVEGGWLILSAVEAGLVNMPQFTAVRLQDLILFKKDTSIPTPTEIEQPASIKTAAPARVATTVVSTVPERIAAAPKRPCADSKRADKSAAQRRLDATDSAAVLELIALARANANRGELAAALAYCNQAIAADKLNPAWTDLLAFILLEQGATAAAEAALKRTLYLDQNRVLTHVNLGNLLLQQPSRRAEAQRHFRTALEILRTASEQQILPDTDGITVGQLREIIQTTIAFELPA